MGPTLLAPETTTKPHLRSAVRTTTHDATSPDFHDLYDLGPDRRLITLGMLRGEGVPAAVARVGLRDSLRGMALTARGARDIAERLHHHLREINSDWNDAALRCAISCILVDFHTGHLRICSTAGCHVLVWERDSWPGVLKSGSEALGQAGTPEIIETVLEINRARRLMVFTDAMFLTSAAPTDAALLPLTRLFLSTLKLPVARQADVLVERAGIGPRRHTGGTLLLLDFTADVPAGVDALIHDPFRAPDDSPGADIDSSVYLG